MWNFPVFNLFSLAGWIPLCAFLLLFHDLQAILTPAVYRAVSAMMPLPSLSANLLDLFAFFVDHHFWLSSCFI